MTKFSIARIVLSSAHIKSVIYFSLSVPVVLKKTYPKNEQNRSSTLGLSHLNSMDILRHLFTSRISSRFFLTSVMDFINPLRLLTHVGFVRQDCLILSEVILYMERSKNHEKKYIITVQKKFTFLRRFDHKSTVSGILRNLINKLVFKSLLTQENHVPKAFQR